MLLMLNERVNLLTMIRTVWNSAWENLKKLI